MNYISLKEFLIVFTCQNLSIRIKKQYDYQYTNMKQILPMQILTNQYWFKYHRHWQFYYQHQYKILTPIPSFITTLSSYQHQHQYQR